MNGCHCYHIHGLQSHPFQNNRSRCPRINKGLSKGHIQNVQHKIKAVLSKAHIQLRSNATCKSITHGHGTPTYIQVKGNNTTRKQRKKKGVSYMLSREHKQNACDLHAMQSRVLPKHIKTKKSMLKYFHFFYLESKFTTCALFQFPSYVHFTSFLWVVVPTHTYTHQNHVFLIFKVMSVLSVG